MAAKTKSGSIRINYELPQSVINLIKQGKIDAAFTKLCTIKGTSPQEERFFNIKRAILATQLEDYMSAESFIAIAKDGIKNYMYFQTLNAEAELALKLQDYDRGIKCCEEAILYGSSDNKRINVNMGRIQEAQGNYAAALKNYEIASNASTNYTVQKEASYHLGVLAFALGYFDIAERALKAAMRPGKISKPIYTKLAAIYLKQGRYQDTLDIVASLKDPKTGQLKIDSLAIAPLIVDKKLGNELPPRKSKLYVRNQIIEYRSDEALAHIKENSAMVSDGTTTDSKGKFSESVNIDQLFSDMSYQLTEENMINEDLLDVYEIDYPNAGYDLSGNLVHRVRVVTIPGTKDILTIYPSGKSAIKKQGSMQAQVEEQKKIGSKRIDSFNARFAKFNQSQQ